MSLVKKMLTEQTLREDREAFNEIRPIASIGQEREHLRELGYTIDQIKGKWDDKPISTELVNTIREQTGIDITKSSPTDRVRFIYALKELNKAVDSIDLENMYLTGSQIYDVKNLIGKLNKKIKVTEGGSNG